MNETIAEPDESDVEEGLETSEQWGGDFPTPPESTAPKWNTPAGPVWTVSGREEGRRLRIRRVDGAPGLLRLGAVFRHAAIADHPRLRAPILWWRDGEDTYLATTLPEGEPLSEALPPRPTWSVAVDAIIPLAIALKDAHRRGVVHGSLAPWNVFYEGEMDHLTAVDFSTWVADPLEAGPFTPPEMVGAPNRRSPLPATDIHNLARLLIFFALSPEEAYRDRPNFETIPAYGISALERAIQKDPAHRPQTIDEFLAGLSFEPHWRAPAAMGNTAGNVQTGRVRGVEVFEHKSRGKGVRFHLDGPGDDFNRADSQGVFVYAEQEPAVFDSFLRLWEGAELNLMSAKKVEDSGGRTYLTADGETLPVIAPHWPVSVSDVLKARGCPQRVVVDLRDGGERTYHLAFGNLVHGFLEDLATEEELTFEEALRLRLPDLRLEFLAAGVDDAKLATLIEDGKAHFENLRRFARPRTLHASPGDRVGWCGENAEVTRYSTRYGLEGRTDLVVTDQDQGLQIVELKSGKPWHDHAGQVQSYALLWEELARAEGMSTTGHLLYSRTGQMKEVRLDGVEDRHGLMHGRNGLMALYRSFVDPGSEYRAPYFMEDPTLCRQNECRFRRDRCKAQTELLGLNPKRDTTGARPDIPAELLRQARRYHAHLTRLVEMERWADHMALGAIFQPHRLTERIADGSAATNLRLLPDRDDQDQGDRRRAYLEGEDLHVFSPGDRILIHRGDIDAAHLFRARVMTRDTGAGQGHLEVKLDTGHVTEEMAGLDWTADVMPARLGYRTAHRALYRVVSNGNRQLLEVLLRPGDVATDVLTSREEEKSGELHPATKARLNESQRDALYHALCDRPASLIQGPPGTGKTTVIAHICLELVERQKKVLLCALTNTAVDTMLIKVLDAALIRGEEPPPFLRLGSASRSPLLADELRRRGLDPTEYFSDDRAKKAGSLAAIDNILRWTKIIATTAHSAMGHPVSTFYDRISQGPAFDVALIDEASQLSEPMALAPISMARRFVLVGDHRQLPPIVTSEQVMTAFLVGPSTGDIDDDLDGDAGRVDHGEFAADSTRRPFPLAPSLLDAGMGGLDISLFERLARFLSPWMLTTQYRMHKGIMSFPADQFYEGRLVAHESVADHRLDLKIKALPPHLAEDLPVVFVDVAGEEVGRTNPEEARALLETAQLLCGATEGVTLGILSPFRAQVHLLRSLRSEFEISDGCDIDTVERFQGNERDVILASLVKTERPGEFLSDARRLNVALTRARKKLIIFGSRECLVQDPTFRQWLSSPQTTVVSWKSSL